MDYRPRHSLSEEGYDSLSEVSRKVPETMFLGEKWRLRAVGQSDALN